MLIQIVQFIFFEVLIMLIHYANFLPKGKVRKDFCLLNLMKLANLIMKVSEEKVIRRAIFYLNSAMYMKKIYEMN